MEDLEITIRQLRNLLFDVGNENQTVKELRLKLFNEENQDFKLNRITRRKLNSF
jgi:hypothetical protein